MEEEYIEHFSHKQHKLRFFQVDADEDPKPYQCNICGLPILSSPSYTCSNNDANCNFFIHKACAQLPQSFRYVDHLDTLILQQPNLESSQHFTYKCQMEPVCKFELHPLAAKAVEIKTKHKSHTHPLVAICKEISCLCDGCDKEQKGFFFHCRECNFWIHQDCTVLPSVVKLPSHHPHPYILTFSHIFNVTRSPRCRCSFCHQLWRFGHRGLYFCGECSSYAHITCVKSSSEFLKSETSVESIQLPYEGKIFPSLVIRKYMEKNPLSENDGKKYHEHPLILEDGINMSSTSTEAESGNSVCDVCIQPINVASPFYRCQLHSSNNCHFLAHQICANHLPTSLQLFARNSRMLHQMEALDDCNQSQVFFSSVFLCFNCRRPSNGFCYYIREGPSGFSMIIDIECALAPKTTYHASHRQHLLFQTINSKDSPLSCCSRRSLGYDVYKCVSCNFYIHIGCALLPKTIRDKFDEHPLELILSHRHEDGQKYNCFCEVCEQDINPQYWYYGCGKCEQYFHINCIPSVGYLSKVKFGKTIVIPPHDHPLFLTRMLTVGRNERCRICRKIIKGFKDKMAFHCPLCDFWVHFVCAWDDGYLEYSESLLYKHLDEAM